MSHLLEYKKVPYVVKLHNSTFKKYNKHLLLTHHYNNLLRCLIERSFIRFYLRNDKKVCLGYQPYNILNDDILLQLCHSITYVSLKSPRYWKQLQTKKSLLQNNLHPHFDRYNVRCTLLWFTQMLWPQRMLTYHIFWKYHKKVLYIWIVEKELRN